MTLHGFALFVHVVAAILLVGGSAYTHMATALVRRARTVDGIRSNVGWLHALVKASGPLAGIVLLAGLYLAFAGRWWGAGWPVVSLALFAVAGTCAAGFIDPRVGAVHAALAEAPDGPVTPQVQALLVDPTLTRATWVLSGADLAIVFLMTNKPGWAGSLVVATVGLALGVATGLRESRHATASAPAPAMPAT